jgi:hypothetical protein
MLLAAVTIIYSNAEVHLPIRTLRGLAGSQCDVIPKANFCLCSDDSECIGKCILFGEIGACATDYKGHMSASDPCDRSQNDPYQLNDCILQSARKNDQHPICDGAHFNLDLYVKSETDSTFDHRTKDCVTGYNMLRVAKQTIEQCKTLCLELNLLVKCVGFEYGVDYGGAGLSTKESEDCKETENPANTPSTPQPTESPTPVPQIYTSSPTPQPTNQPTVSPTPSPAESLDPCEAPSGRHNFCPCDNANQCEYGGCYYLFGNRRQLQVSSRSGKACADPTSFRNSGPDSVCQFPFTFRDQTFTACTREGDTGGRLWCSTKVDAAGRHVSGGGFLHHCETPAPTPAPQPNNAQGTTQDNFQQQQPQQQQQQPQNPVTIITIPAPAPPPAPAPVTVVPVPAPSFGWNGGWGGGGLGWGCRRYCGILIRRCCA